MRAIPSTAAAGRIRSIMADSILDERAKSKARPARGSDVGGPSGLELPPHRGHRRQGITDFKNPRFGDDVSAGAIAALALLSNQGPRAAPWNKNLEACRF